MGGSPGNVSLIENIPVYSVNLSTGNVTIHGSDYLYSRDYPVKNGWVTGIYKGLYLFLEDIYRGAAVPE